MTYTVKDSGRRRQYKTGAQRDRAIGKGRFDLISPFMLARLAKHLELGAIKYRARNWEAGIPVTDCLDSSARHLSQYAAGLRDEDHLAAVIFNAMAIIHYEEMVKRGILPKSLFDGLGQYTKKRT